MGKNKPNPYPKRESKNLKFAYGVFRRYGDVVRVSYHYDGSVNKTQRVVLWQDLPEDIKKYPEIAELNPDRKPV